MNFDKENVPIFCEKYQDLKNERIKCNMRVMNLLTQKFLQYKFYEIKCRNFLYNISILRICELNYLAWKTSNFKNFNMENTWISHETYKFLPKRVKSQGALEKE